MSSLPPSSSSAVVLNEDDSRTSSSSSSQASLSHFLTQNQNPYQNQTDQPLEDAFARLYVSPFDFNYSPSITDGFSSLNGVSNNHSFDSPTFHPPQRSNLYGRTRETNAVIGGGLPPLPNSLSGYDIQRENVNWNNLRSGSYPALSASGSYSRNNNGFLDSEALVRQTGFGGGVMNDQFLLGNRFDVNNGMSSPSPHLLNNLRGRVVLLPPFLFIGPHRENHAYQGNMDLISVMKRLTATSNETSFIFLELIDHVAELMVNPFGNYVVQKLVEICNEDQMTLIILRVIRPEGDHLSRLHRAAPIHPFINPNQPNLMLVKISLNPHGTRSVEKLLENITTQQQRALVMSALSPGAATLATDANGHRVLLHCLKYFPAEDNKNLLKEVANHCFGIATDKTGCCVLPHCVDNAHGEIKKQLIAEIIVNAPLLAEDAYGNYVVQHLVSSETPIVTECLLRQLEGKFLSLSRNKYGSNVVEKLIEEAGDQHKRRIFLELLQNPDVARLLVDPFGNYVIHCAVKRSKGAIQDALLQLIQINSPMMRTNVYGRKLLEKFGSGKLRR